MDTTAMARFLPTLTHEPGREPRAGTHSQLREAWWFGWWLLIGSVCQGGDDPLPMAQQVHFQYLQGEITVTTGTQLL